MQINYENWSCEIFEGFYETIIGNFDSIFESEPTPPEGYFYDVNDWNGYENEVGRKFTNILKSKLNTDILNNLEFKSIYSPREYNFTTDKINIKMNVNIDKLKEYCFKTNRPGFDKYLNDNFTSRDGFMSFIFNNVHDFEIDLDNDFDRNIQVMIEFYLLNNVNFEDVKEDLYEKLFDIQLDYVCLWKEGTDEYFNYTLSDDGESVIIGDKINEI